MFFLGGLTCCEYDEKTMVALGIDLEPRVFILGVLINLKVILYILIRFILNHE